MTLRYLCLLALLGLLWACEKDELPVAPFDRGDVQLGEVDMGAGYSHVHWFSLSENKVLATALLTDWDLAIEGGSDGWRILLNDGRLMRAWVSPASDVASASDTAGFSAGAELEVAATAYTAPALGDWRDTQPVYLIDLGYTTLGQAMGYVWLQIFQNPSGGYLLSWRGLHDDAVETASLQPLENGAYLYYNLRNQSFMEGPASTSWALQFRRYTYLFEEPPMPYLVTGVIVNTEQFSVAQASDSSFATLIMADTLGLHWDTTPDAIGYDWKTYSFDSGTYEVAAHRCWIIRSAQGFYYKLRFVDFYGADGRVGVPQFEFQLL